MKHAHDMDVGDTFTYPNHEWEWIVEVPETVARQWISNVAPNATIGNLRGETSFSAREWLNKLAVVVAVDRGPVALYKHDFACWVIKHRSSY